MKRVIVEVTLRTFVGWLAWPVYDSVEIDDGSSKRDALKDEDGVKRK
jgi:hypothetical protein